MAAEAPSVGPVEPEPSSRVDQSESHALPQVVDSPTRSSSPPLRLSILPFTSPIAHTSSADLPVVHLSALPESAPVADSTESLSAVESLKRKSHSASTPSNFKREPIQTRHKIIDFASVAGSPRSSAAAPLVAPVTPLQTSHLSYATMNVTLPSPSPRPPLSASASASAPKRGVSASSPRVSISLPVAAASTPRARSNGPTVSTPKYTALASPHLGSTSLSRRTSADVESVDLPTKVLVQTPVFRVLDRSQRLASSSSEATGEEEEDISDVAYFKRHFLAEWHERQRYEALLKTRVDKVDKRRRTPAPTQSLSRVSSVGTPAPSPALSALPSDHTSTTEKVLSVMPSKPIDGAGGIVAELLQASVDAMEVDPNAAALQPAPSPAVGPSSELIAPSPSVAALGTPLPGCSPMPPVERSSSTISHLSLSSTQAAQPPPLPSPLPAWLFARPYFNYPWQARPWRRPEDCWIRIVDPNAVVPPAASFSVGLTQFTQDASDGQRRRSATAASAVWASVTPRAHASTPSNKRKGDAHGPCAKSARLVAAESEFSTARAAAVARAAGDVSAAHVKRAMAQVRLLRLQQQLIRSREHAEYVRASGAMLADDAEMEQ